MKKKYEDYVALFDSTPSKLLRDFLKRPHCGEKDILYNRTVRYFNKEHLHKKYTESDFNALNKKYIKEINNGKHWIG